MIVNGNFYLKSNKEPFLIQIDAIEYEERPHDAYWSDNIVLYGEQLKLFKSLDHDLSFMIGTIKKSDFVSDLAIMEDVPVEDNTILEIKNAIPSGSWKYVRLNITISDEGKQPYCVSLVNDYEKFFKDVTLNGDILSDIAKKTVK